MHPKYLVEWWARIQYPQTNDGKNYVEVKSKLRCGEGIEVCLMKGKGFMGNSILCRKKRADQDSLEGITSTAGSSLWQKQS